MRMGINEELMEAVSSHDVESVKELLEEGADANFKMEYDSENQPDTPLKLVMFRISDCDLTDEDLKEFAEIAKLLLEYGADPKPAMKFAEERYGKFDPKGTGAFMDVWKIVAGR